MPISLFSEYTGIPQSTLRFYDKHGVLTPAFRSDGNARRYSPFQIILAKAVRVLSQMKVPLETITSHFSERTPESMLNLMSAQTFSIMREIERLSTAQAVLTTYFNLIQSGLSADTETIAVADMDEMRFSLGAPNSVTGDPSFYSSFVRFCSGAEDYGINLNFPVGGYSTSFKDFRSSTVVPEYFASITPFGNRIRPAGKYIVGYVRGYYGNVGDVTRRMLAFAAANGFATDGPVYQIYLQDELSQRDPTQYLLRITTPAKRLSRSRTRQAR
jgi:DNA-binding transcriptional MerR regulator